MGLFNTLLEWQAAADGAWEVGKDGQDEPPFGGGVEDAAFVGADAGEDAAGDGVGGCEALGGVEVCGHGRMGGAWADIEDGDAGGHGAGVEALEEGAEGGLGGAVGVVTAAPEIAGYGRNCGEG